MKAQGAADRLREFQTTGSRDRLLAYVDASGRDREHFERAWAGLEPVLRPLGHGFQPAVGQLDVEALEAVAEPTAEILEWLADSPKADLREAAFRLMGALGRDRFLPRLALALSSPAAWERSAAVAALATQGTVRARALLARALDDPDAAVATAARRALARPQEASE